jgi:hypothetical protein
MLVRYLIFGLQQAKRPANCNLTPFSFTQDQDSLTLSLYFRYLDPDATRKGFRGDIAL